MMPLIGIFADVDEKINNHLPNPYVHAIERAGGMPLHLPYVTGEGAVAEFIALCDGFFFTGGVDVDPALYGAEKHEKCGELHPLRDSLEKMAFEKALASGKPILGVCRGAQFINVMLGGALYQDIPTECPSDIRHVQGAAWDTHGHAVSVVAGTPLADLIGAGEHPANSFHHQAICTLGAGLAVMATAADGTVEAVWLPSHPYLRAYQWHPERLVDTDAAQASIMRDFILAAEQSRAGAEQARR